MSGLAGNGASSVGGFTPSVGVSAGLSAPFTTAKVVANCDCLPEPQLLAAKGLQVVFLFLYGETNWPLALVDIAYTAINDTAIYARKTDSIFIEITQQQSQILLSTGLSQRYKAQLRSHLAHL